MFLLFYITALLFCRNVVLCNPSVDTNVGTIKGLTSGDGTYSLYMGIPFATVNSSNPFGTAAEYPCFEETYEAYDDSAICPQVNMLNRELTGTLDCLRLNVYVPKTASSTNKLPVMVWIYGGGYRQGYASRVLYGPDLLVRHNIILVTLNYRVGAYGFMSLDTPEIPGNQGLKDQYMGMKWVYDNIEAFGGDRNNMTLSGQSAGGHSVELHIRSLRKLFFTKFTIESGSSVAATVLLTPDRKAHFKMAAYLGYNTTDANDALNFLAKTDPRQVVNASNALNLSFKPCVEKVFDGVDSFITTSWVDAPIPKVANKSVLVGFNENELMTYYLTKNASDFKTMDLVKERIQLLFDMANATELEILDTIIRHFYLGDKPVSKGNQWPIIDFDSDYTYIHPELRSIREYVQGGAANIYYYMFSYSGGRNVDKRSVNITVAGASHSDELGYLFNMTIMPEDPSTEDQLMIDRMTTMWTNFVKYGDPTPKKTALLPVKWVPLRADKYHCMKINSKMSIINRPLHERLAFWDLFYHFYKKYQKTFDD